jgi:hypothetical protein
VGWIITAARNRAIDRLRPTLRAGGLVDQVRMRRQIKNACQSRPTRSGGGAGGREPEPDWLGVAVAGQVIDLQAD